MEVLSQQGEGAFLVRESASSPGSHALSLKGPQGKIVHFLIQTSPNGVNLQVSREGWGWGWGFVALKLEVVTTDALVQGSVRYSRLQF